MYTYIYIYVCKCPICSYLFTESYLFISINIIQNHLVGNYLQACHPRWIQRWWSRGDSTRAASKKWNFIDNSLTWKHNEIEKQDGNSTKISKIWQYLVPDWFKQIYAMNFTSLLKNSRNMGVYILSEFIVSHGLSENRAYHQKVACSHIFWYKLWQPSRRFLQRHVVRHLPWRHRRLCPLSKMGKKTVLGSTSILVAKHVAKTIQNHCQISKIQHDSS